MNQKSSINIALIVLVIVIIGAVGYFALAKKLPVGESILPVSLSQKNDVAFASLNLPSSFTLVAQTERKEKGDFIVTPENVVQVRTYKVSMNMAQAKEILLGRMRENEDKSIVWGSPPNGRVGHLVGEYTTHEEAFEVANSYNANRPPGPENDFYDVYYGKYGDIRASMHSRGRGVDSLAKFCAPGAIALKSGTYMTVIFSDTEDGARVEIDSDGQVVGFDSFGTFDRRFEREFCSIEPDESYVTIVMWAA